MDSKVLEEYGFTRWYGMVEISKNKNIVPPQAGVYIFRLKWSFGRLRERSDILYIGSSENLYDRIVWNYLERHGGKTTQRIHNYLFKKGYLKDVEVSWVITNSYNELESKLLGIYEEEHHELPPWNRQRG